MNKNETFNTNELRHLAVNYAISCEKGYDGTFDGWYKGINKIGEKSQIRKTFHRC